MSREDIAKLLGGYATGTLTPEEQRALFAAALEDQALFDELAREQALRDVLREPAARGQLLAALEDHPRWHRRFGSWMMRPAALTAAAACLLLLTSVAVWRPWRSNQAPKPAIIATALPQEAPPIPSPPAAAEQKAAPAARAVAKAQPPATSRIARGAASPAATANKELLLAESAAPLAAAHQTNAPVAALSVAAPPAASPAPPPAPKATNQNVTANVVIAPGSTAETIEVVPGVAAPAAAGQAIMITAGSALVNGPQPNGAVGMTAGGDARQRYYAGGAYAAADAEARSQAFRAGSRTREGQSAPLGIKWSILRRDANGRFAPINAEDLRAGDTVELRVAVNQNCDLSVFDNASGKLTALFTKHVEAGETVDTPPLAAREKGLRELAIGLTRNGSAIGAIAGVPPVLSQEGQQSETDRNEHATYTVGPSGAPELFFSVSLDYR
ncbi:MAG: hypothetical protein WB579_06145 [Bryobacteraceae bacterium]